MVTRVFPAGPVELSYAEGPDSGPPVVLLHGVVRRWQDFEPIFPALIPRSHLHAVDFRGHGASGRTPGGYRVVDYVGDIVALLEKRIMVPAVLIGHSLGGMVAAGVAAAVPDLVRGIVFEDPPFEMMGRRIAETSYLSLFGAYRDLLDSTDSVDALAAALAEVPIAVPGTGQFVRLGDQRDAASLQWLASCLGQIDPDVLTPLIEGRWLDGFDTGELLSRVTCPGLFIQADDSAGGVLPDGYALSLVEKMPRVRHTRLAGVGHNIHITKPEEMARLTTSFLDSLD
ncbi:alpha/beta hydrolase [Isosphaeraceae bacterium EP7]